MSVVAEDRRFHTHDREQMAAWWAATQETARAALIMDKGGRIYVTETLDELARTSREVRFVEVHVVSVATGSLDEADRVVNVPPLRRLIPLDRIANIAPIVDAQLHIASDGVMDPRD